MVARAVVTRLVGVRVPAEEPRAVIGTVDMTSLNLVAGNGVWVQIPPALPSVGGWNWYTRAAQTRVPARA